MRASVTFEAEELWSRFIIQGTENKPELYLESVFSQIVKEENDHNYTWDKNSVAI